LCLLEREVQGGNLPRHQATKILPIAWSRHANHLVRQVDSREEKWVKENILA
jgi:hypothetical protein